MAGHSAWKNIKHKKAANDARRGKVWSKCARAVIVAARSGGGDPETNLGLRYAIDDAKAANMPKDTIEKAVKKGTGELGSENYEAALYEGYGPGGVAILMEILTDNRNRTAPELRGLFEKAGGNLGVSGCVGRFFDPRGQIDIDKTAAGEETVMTAALEAGADDVSDEEDTWQVLCDPTQLMAVRQALEQAGLTLAGARLTRIPNTTIPLEGDAAQKAITLLEALEDHDDVQKVYTNLAVEA